MTRTSARPTGPPRAGARGRQHLRLTAVTMLTAALLTAAAGSAAAAAGPTGAGVGRQVTRVAATPVTPATPARPVPPSPPVAPVAPSPAPSPGGVTVDLTGVGAKPSQSLVILLALTLLSLAPALLALTTSFTKIIVVLSLTRNALGLQSVPPNQVLAGLALFLSLFVMTPVLSAVYDGGVKPYLAGEVSVQQAYDAGSAPLKTFMLDHTRSADLTMLVAASKSARPVDRAHVSLATLVPAFVLSELKSAFVIGFVIFLPFLVIDLVVSSSLMAMGMMMMPPVLVSLPFKLLLFVLVDGWALVAQTLVASYT